MKPVVVTDLSHNHISQISERSKKKKPRKLEAWPCAGS
jgi:hypothetical protein